MDWPHSKALSTATALVPPVLSGRERHTAHLDVVERDGVVPVFRSMPNSRETHRHRAGAGLYMPPSLQENIYIYIYIYT